MSISPEDELTQWPVCLLFSLPPEPTLLAYQTAYPAWLPLSKRPMVQLLSSADTHTYYNKYSSQISPSLAAPYTPTGPIHIHSRACFILYLFMLI